MERLIGDAAVLRQLQPEAFTDAVFGCRPSRTSCGNSRNPDAIRARFSRPVSFLEGVEKLEDLQPGMVLEATTAIRVLKFGCARGILKTNASDAIYKAINDIAGPSDRDVVLAHKIEPAFRDRRDREPLLHRRQVFVLLGGGAAAGYRDRQNDCE